MPDELLAELDDAEIMEWSIYFRLHNEEIKRQMDEAKRNARR